MFKKMQLAGFFMLGLSPVYAAESSDTNVVDRLRVDASGVVAVSVTGGFTAANAANQCSSSAVWATPSTANAGADMAFIKSVLLAAKAGGDTVDIVTEGCTPEGLLIIQEVTAN